MTFLINEKTIILSKLTCAFICMLFHQVVALLWYHFVLSHQCYFISFPSRKRRICVHPCLLACSRDRMVGERLLAMKPSHSGKQRLERTAKLFPVCGYSDGQGRVHVKQNQKCSSEHFLFISLTQKSPWPGEVDFCQRAFSQDLSLMLLADEVLEGLYLKALALRLGCK